MDESKDEMEYHGFAESINDNAVNNAVDADACMQVVCVVVESNLFYKAR